MFNKKIVKIYFIILTLTFIFLLAYFYYYKKDNNINLETVSNETKENVDIVYKSNVIENVNYNTKDSDGNEYSINALKGEIDFSNPNIIYLTDVKAFIKLKNSDNITITSNYGKYNSNNFDTIFSKNVIIIYLDNKINGEYLDFSLERNSMIISKNVVYTNVDNILKSDVIEIDIKSKDIKIFMHEKKKKVNIKSKN